MSEAVSERLFFKILLVDKMLLKTLK